MQSFLKSKTEQTDALLLSNTKHTDDLLRLTTKHTHSSKTEHTESLLRSKPPMKPSILKVSNRFFAVFIRSSQLGTTEIFSS